MDHPLPENITRQPAGFNGTEAQQIDLATAAILTATDRRQNPTQPHGYFFGRNIIEQILAQPGCQGLRIYFGVVPSPPPAPPHPAPAGGWHAGQRHLLIVGADAAKNDQLVLPAQPVKRMVQAAPAEAREASTASTTAGIIAEMAIPCPNQCSVSNPLNS